MPSYSKEKQCLKNKKENPKKMSRTKQKRYIDFLRDISEEVCQLPGCNNKAADWEHPERGINRNDMDTIMICRDCHMKADGQTKVSVDEKSRLKLEGKRIGRENWEEYTRWY